MFSCICSLCGWLPLTGPCKLPEVRIHIGISYLVFHNVGSLSVEFSFYAIFHVATAHVHALHILRMCFQNHFGSSIGSGHSKFHWQDELQTTFCGAVQAEFFTFKYENAFMHKKQHEAMTLIKPFYDTLYNPHHGLNNGSEFGPKCFFIGWFGGTRNSNIWTVERNTDSLNMGLKWMGDGLDLGLRWKTA